MNGSKTLPDERRASVPVNFILPGDVHTKAKRLALDRRITLKVFMIEAIANATRTQAKRKGDVV